MWSYEKALDVLLESDGGFVAGSCKEDDSWYLSKNLLSLRSFIVKETACLDNFFPSYRLRMLCFKLGIFSTPVCQYCNLNLRVPVFHESRFRPTCSDVQCRKLHKSICTRKMHEEMSDEKRKIKNRKIGTKNSGTFDEKFEKEKSRQLKLDIGKRSRSRIQSQIEKLKRVSTRRKNNALWHSEETKKKISKSNQATHLSEIYKQQHIETIKNSRSKQSMSLKNRILAGEFTPRNNWKKTSRINLAVNNETLCFRSMWEVAFYLTVREKSGEELQYEHIRIPYEFDGKRRVYIVDFFSKRTSSLIEIRPKCRQYNLPKEASKFESAAQWSQSNNLKFTIIDEDWFDKNWHDVEKALINFASATGQIISFQKPKLCHT